MVYIPKNVGQTFFKALPTWKFTKPHNFYHYSYNLTKIKNGSTSVINCRQILYHLSHQGSPINFLMLVTQYCLTLCDPADCSPPGSSVHGNLQTRILEWVSHSFHQGIFMTQGSNPSLPHCRQILYH